MCPVGWRDHKARDPTSEGHHRNNAIPELDNESYDGHHDHDGDNREDQIKEGRHQFDNARDDRVESCIDIKIGHAFTSVVFSL